MPTDPIPGMLNREDAVESAAPLIELACPLLRESVNQATHVDQRCERYVTDEPDVDLPAFTLFRQMMEMTDGVEVLLSSSCVQPAFVFLRSSFEASVELGYLVQREFRARALSWVYCYNRNRIRQIEAQHPDTEQGREFWTVWEEEFGQGMDLDPEEFRDPEVLREFLAAERFEPIAEAYDEAPGRRPDWYQLFDGPNNRREVAQVLGRRTEYDVFYRKWSTYAHGRTFSHYVDSRASLREGRTIANNLRYAGNLRAVATIAINLMLRGMNDLLSHYRPTESLDAWWQREIDEDFTRLREIEIEEDVQVWDPW